MRGAWGGVRVAIAGSTGSIGRQALDVLEAAGERFELTALAAGGSNVDGLVQQARRHRPGVVAVAVDDARTVQMLRDALPFCEVRCGADAVASLPDMADIVVNGIVGFAGLEVTLATLLAGRRLALANKESLIAAGPVVQQARRTRNAELVPVDSEHAALHMCLQGVRYSGEVARLVLTASGGPLRGRSAEDLEDVTREEALAHPTWSMGPKISVDSSTLMNKGLEVIEANELFGEVAGELGCAVRLQDIEVVVHPQSIVHSMVELRDGATIAQLSMPDMRLPISWALGYPGRLRSPFGAIDWATVGSLDFEAPDRRAFRALDLAYGAARTGGGAPAWLSAANEVAVDAFLRGVVAWRDIVAIVAATLDCFDGAPLSDIDDVRRADSRARAIAQGLVGRVDARAKPRLVGGAVS